MEKSDKKGKKVKSPRGSATRQKSLPIEKKLGSPSKQNSKAVKEKMSPKNLFSPRRSSTQKKIHSMDFQDSPVHLYKNNLAVPEDGITHHRSSSHVEMIDLPPRERKRSTTNSSIPVHLEED
uniref:Uncharacterized protein n=1 Tax=Arcella intermedia TaxID=1963864 RepID=A0A6B2LM54_9EUKA